MKKVIVMLLVLALGLASVSLAVEGTWSTRADMPTGRWDLSTCVVDGKIYAFGGGSPFYQASRTVEEYNPATDTWTTKSEMPTARQGLSTSVVNGKIYAIGGGVSPSSSYNGTRTLSTVEKYDPATDTWTTKSEMLTARGFHSASVVDGRIYIIGGSPSIPFSGVLALDVYDPATDTWTRKGNIPRARYTGSFTGVVDGKIYVMGGDGSGRRVDEYDPVTDAWTQKTNMPTYRTDQSTCVLDGKIYVLGGEVGSPYRGMVTVDVYDPVTDTWTTAPDIPTGRFGLRTSVVDGKIYAIGGISGWPSTAYGTVEEYDIGLTVSSPDFNGDGIVDSLDFCIMVDHWDTDEPLCDIAPPPYGDGIIDVQDLIVLSEHLFTCPGAVAYWKLDETEGMFAADSAGDNDAFVVGGTVWQPGSGQVDGALQLDGVSGCAIAGAVLNPAEGPFSVLAWINGGAPGQVVVSQQGAANWLTADAEGNLMTELKCTGRSAGPLFSETVITDGQWHRIGLFWDGLHRTLFVDGVTVAEDTQPGLKSSQMGLYIGTGKAMEPGTYFSGMIDDVRIYNRAVKP
jgi:N-acetylneuraminic acid mutarotase